MWITYCPNTIGHILHSLPLLRIVHPFPVKCLFIPHWNITYTWVCFCPFYSVPCLKQYHTVLITLQYIFLAGRVNPHFFSYIFLAVFPHLLFQRLFTVECGNDNVRGSFLQTRTEDYLVLVQPRTMLCLYTYIYIHTHPYLKTLSCIVSVYLNFTDVFITVLFFI